MKAKTRFFGDIDIAEDKVITLERGMIGFPELTHYGLIFDEEKGIESSEIMWLQSLDDGDVAFPVMIPTSVMDDYAPNVNEEFLEPIGELVPDNTYILVTVTVPKKVEEFSINLKAPIIINTDTHKGVQLIIEDDYPIKYKVYDLLKQKKEKAGE